MTEEQNFQVNLRGIIDLLSNHLYSGPQVYIREMLQNGVDAIAARRHSQPDHQGEVTFEIVPPRTSDDGPTAPTLIVRDNGVGLTESEVHEFLATIGRSSKRDEIRSDDFIGQFGIGLLSAFLVCEEIVVITKSIRPDSPVVQWKGRVDGTYEVSVLDLDFEPGTQVYLRGKPGCNEFFEFSFVTEQASYFGRFLDSDIRITSGQQIAKISDTPVWELIGDGSNHDRSMLLEVGREALGQDFFDAIPINVPSVGVQGVLYVLPHSTVANAGRSHRVYLKRMLLSESVDNLLPDWAFFVKGILNVSGLRPTAAREGFYEDEALSDARIAIGNCLRNYLVSLAKTDRNRLDALIGLHFLPIKALAAEDDEFFRLFMDWLPFETSLGMMTLGEYRKNHSPIRYVATRDQFRQISSVAAAEDICVINAGYVYDAQLLAKAAHALPDVKVEQVDIGEMARDFKELELDERERVFELVRIADLVLQPMHCRAEVKKFHPANLPTLYTSNDDATFLRSLEKSKENADDLWSGVLDSIGKTPAASASSQLCLNFNNPLVQQLAGLNNRELQQRSIEMLYVQALLLGHFPLGPREMSLLGSGMHRLIELAVTGNESDPENSGGPSG